VSWLRLFWVTVAATLFVWLASLVVWIVVLWSALSSWCGESMSDSECAAKQSGALGTSIFFGLFLGATAVALLYLVIRRASRPRVQRNRWYVLSAALIAPMPTAVVIAGILVGHTAGREVGVTFAMVLSAAWASAWALGHRWTTSRELRSRGPQAVAGGLPDPSSTAL
jgi:hypothetical protein